MSASADVGVFFACWHVYKRIAYLLYAILIAIISVYDTSFFY